MMAEEPRQKNTYVQDTRKCLRKRAFFIVLQVLFVCVFLETSFGVPQTPVVLASGSDLSVPLWGGAVTALNSASLQNSLPTHEIKLHHFDQLPCGSCHEAPVAGGDFTEAGDMGWGEGVDVNRSCTSFGCHEYDEKMNHPLDVPIPAGVSSRMPSGSASTVTCLSCHQPQEPLDTGIAQDRADRLLQASEAVGCESCHERMSGSFKQQSHWKFSRKAHLVSLVSGVADDATRGDFMDYSGGIDAESNTCLSCHDEITVTVPGMNETQQEKADRFSRMADHPIGMNYEYILSQNPMYFNSLMGNKDRIRMFDGNVGCGSCHSLYSDIPSNLTAESEESGLCRTCHNR